MVITVIKKQYWDVVWGMKKRICYYLNTDDVGSWLLGLGSLVFRRGFGAWKDRFHVLEAVIISVLWFPLYNYFTAVINHCFFVGIAKRFFGFMLHFSLSWDKAFWNNSESFLKNLLYFYSFSTFKSGWRQMIWNESTALIIKRGCMQYPIEINIQMGT